MPARYVAAQRPNRHHAPDTDHDDETLADWINRNNRPTKGGLTWQQWLARNNVSRKRAAKKKGPSSSSTPTDTPRRSIK